MSNIKPEIIEKTIKYGEGRYRISKDGSWQVLTFGKHGPNDPPVGLSYKWDPIPADSVPAEVRKAV